MAIIDFGGVEEKVITREEFPVEKAREVLQDESIAVIGYGVQGPAQALNMKDDGLNVIVGQASRFKNDWDRAVAEGWVHRNPTDRLSDRSAARDDGIGYSDHQVHFALRWRSGRSHGVWFGC